MNLSTFLSNAAIKGAAIKPITEVKMCTDCAFKTGTNPNNDEDFIDGLSGSMCMGAVLSCHIENKVCAGFLYAKRYFETFE